jgi:hypothetical protein
MHVFFNFVLIIKKTSDFNMQIKVDTWHDIFIDWVERIFDNNVPIWKKYLT